MQKDADIYEYLYGIYGKYVRYIIHLICRLIIKEGQFQE